MNVPLSFRIITRTFLPMLLVLSLELTVHAQQGQPTFGSIDATLAEATGTTNLDEQQTPPYPQGPVSAKRLTLGDRLDLYTHSIVNPETIVGPAFGAAVNQARNEPPEWGQGADGYGVRFASGYGRVLIGRTIRFGVAAFDHEDPRFLRSNETGFWRRARFATVHYFVVPTDKGSQIPAFSRFAGAYGAAFISNAWYPESRANSYHAALRGTTALSAGFAWNMFREFWPDIKRRIRK